MPLAVSVVTDGTDCQRAVVWYPPWHHHPLVAPPERSPCILRKEEAFPQVNVSVPGQNKLFFRIAFTLLFELVSLLCLSVYNCFHIFTLLFIFSVIGH